MPTLHVTPDGRETLQLIADALWKARKVVVITGAGISTSSGIPDFRSENGLYSLIQEQFDNASAASSSQLAAVDAPGSRGSGSGATTPSNESDPDQGRSLKRRRLSPEPTAPGRTEPQDGSSTEPHESAEAGESRPPTDGAPGSPRAAADGVPPAVAEEPSPFNESDSALPPTYGRRTREATSPLSSPPPVLFDPFGRQSPSPSASNGSSEAPENDETPPSSAPMSKSASSHNLQNLPNMKGKDMFDVSIWRDPRRTSVFYTFITSLRCKVKSAEPTTTHHFISHLRDRGKLVRCYTQNIDEIEEKVGLSTCLNLGPGHRGRFSTRAHRASAPAALNRSASDPGTIEIPQVQHSSGVECVYLHGSLRKLRCFMCARITDWEEERESETLSGGQPTCPHCEGAAAAREGRGKRALGVGKLRPDIVLYGEEHPNADLIAPLVQHDLSLNPDMLLILGTSLRVHGLKVMVREFAKTVHSRGGTVVFVNLTKPSESAWADIIDYWVQWDCDSWVYDLKAKKPIMWLPPGTVLPDPKKEAKDKKPKKEGPKGQQPKASGSRKSKGTSTPPAVEDSDAVMADQDTSFDGPSMISVISDVPEEDTPAEQATKKPGNPGRPKQPKPPKPPPVRLPRLEDDKLNEAVLLATLHASLAKIGGRPNNYHSSMRRPLNLKQIKHASRRSTGLVSELILFDSSASTAADSPTVLPTPIPPSKVVKKASTKRKSQAKPDITATVATTRAPLDHIQTPVSVAAVHQAAPPVAELPPVVKHEDAQKLEVPDAAPLGEIGGISDNSIAAAIKSNPRKRKPKMIDGCEVIVPGARRSMAPVQAPTPPPTKPIISSYGATCAAEPVVAAAPEFKDAAASVLPPARQAAPIASQENQVDTHNRDTVPHASKASVGQYLAPISRLGPAEIHSGSFYSAAPINLLSASGPVAAVQESSSLPQDVTAIHSPFRLLPADDGLEAHLSRAPASLDSRAAASSSAQPQPPSGAPGPAAAADDRPTIPGWFVSKILQFSGRGGDDQDWKAPVAYKPLSFPPAPVQRQSFNAFQLTQPLLEGYGGPEPRFAPVAEAHGRPRAVGPNRPGRSFSDAKRDSDRAAEAAMALTSMKATGA